MKQVREQTKPN